MNTERIHETFAELGTQAAFDYYASDLQEATSAECIVEAVAAYLSRWNPRTVSRLQAMIGGWAPFDQAQCPLHIAGADELRLIAKQLEAQRRKFEARGAAITPELFEIDMCFLFARESLDRYRANQEPQEDSQPGRLANVI
jgi:hypothetical protein